MKILLACAGGMSTGMLLKRMLEYSEKEEMNITIMAVGLNELEEYSYGADAVLLGPQVGYYQETIQKKYPHVPITVIDMMDYSMMNGEKILLTAKKIITENIEEDYNG